jgi:hypothetical protein
MGRLVLADKPSFGPSKPLANVKHERFCWAIVQGHRLAPAYEIAGFEGKSSRLPWQLRHKPAVDARVSWLLAERIKANTRAHHRKIADSKLRLIRELERIAFCDPRDVMQWDRVPEFDREGNVLGWRDEVTTTPSRLLTAAQAAQVRSITNKKGAVTFEVHDKLAALDKLARILGVYHEPPTPAPAVMVNQLNIGGDNALEALRRLAFAIAKAQNTQSLLRQPAPSHMIIESAKD